MLASIDHVNLVVNDLERMIAFYRDTLSLEVTKHVTISGDWIDKVVALRGVKAEVVYLSLPAGPNIELIRYHSPEGTAPSDLGQSNTVGLRHLAFRVEDIDAAHTRLSDAGVHLLSDVQCVPSEQVTYTDGVRKRLVYFHDPEGNLLELCEYKSSHRET